MKAIETEPVLKSRASALHACSELIEGWKFNEELVTTLAFHDVSYPFYPTKEMIPGRASHSRFLSTERNASTGASVLSRPRNKLRTAKYTQKNSVSLPNVQKPRMNNGTRRVSDKGDEFDACRNYPSEIERSKTHAFIKSFDRPISAPRILPRIDFPCESLPLISKNLHIECVSPNTAESKSYDSESIYKKSWAFQCQLKRHELPPDEVPVFPRGTRPMSISF